MKDRMPDRRPISARKSPISQRAAAMLAGWGVAPNSISIASVFFSAGAAGCFLLTSRENDILLWWGAAVFILLRLLANMLDGMVAAEADRASPVGEIFNEVPDRISDAVIFIGAGYASGSSEALGYLSAIFSLLVAYIRALGNYMGVPQLFQGPMAKSHRMFTLAAVCIYGGSVAAFFPLPSLMTWGLLVIVLGSILTFLVRLRRIISGVR
ncbi:MAG: CDP-alcohol phosphatidyltransferase family protein [Chloroflexi bacterium]|nr:MAG: CDP-alcohol phosphatidyltransferase family protein [Chloroflexota bacterium]MCQ3938862.1 CDP-alcohol phosphatidyltransferase family protein [Chloroflexota bacterium]MDL1944515.1 CDP-alcohol phosphatidyltransferase family protein [Chloroflexi bacterium CFX2]